MFISLKPHRAASPSAWQSPPSSWSGQVSDATAPDGRDWAALVASLRPRLFGLAMRVLGHVCWVSQKPVLLI